jgi:hypothetical protein
MDDHAGFGPVPVYRHLQSRAHPFDWRRGSIAQSMMTFCESKSSALSNTGRLCLLSVLGFQLVNALLRGRQRFSSYTGLTRLVGHELL